MAINSMIYIYGGGYYQISNITSSTGLVIRNMGYALENVAPGEIIEDGAMVMSSGIQGPTGLPGAITGASSVVLTNLVVTPLAQSGKTILYTTTNDQVKCVFSDGNTALLSGPLINDSRYDYVNFADVFTLEDNGDTLDISLSDLTTTEISEGNNNLYFTDQRAIDALVGSGLLGTASSLDAGTDPGDVVFLDENGKLPVLDGSNLTGIRERFYISSDGITQNDRTILWFKGASVTDNPAEDSIEIDTSNASLLGGRSLNYILNRNNHTNKLPVSELSSGSASTGQVIGFNGLSWGPITINTGGNGGGQISNVLPIKQETLTTDYTHEASDETIVFVLDPNSQSREFILDNGSVLGQYLIIKNKDTNFPIRINSNGAIIYELSMMSGINSISLTFLGGTEWVKIN